MTARTDVNDLVINISWEEVSRYFMEVFNVVVLIHLLAVHVLLVLAIEVKSTTICQDMPREFASCDYFVIFAACWFRNKSKLLFLFFSALHAIAHSPDTFILTDEHRMIVPG